MAAFDRRRIGAPESSHSLVFDHVEAGPSRQAKADSIFLRTGLISQANGSAYIESGGVKIACSVFGPRPKPPPYSPEGTLNLEVKFAPFASDPRRAPLRDTEPAALSTLISDMLVPTLQLHLLPKSSVDVFLLVLESDSVPGMLSAGLTVASVAAADAGIAMSALGVGTSQEEESARLVLGSMPALGRVTSLWMAGEGDVDSVSKMVENSAGSAKATHAVVAQAILEGLSQK